MSWSRGAGLSGHAWAWGSQAKGVPRLPALGLAGRMKLLVQRIARATVEVDGLIESRVGQGLACYVAVSDADSEEDVEKLAAEVAKLKLWPDMYDTEKLWSTDLAENGFEVLVVLQQSLLASFPGQTPDEQGVPSASAAKPVFEAFVKALQTEYQEEMVVAAPVEGDIRVESVADGLNLFSVADAPKPGAKAKAAKHAGRDLTQADIPEVTLVLQRLVRLPRPRALQEAARAFTAFKVKKFRDAFFDAPQPEADAFAEALDAASKYFTAKQQGLISAWTGLQITAAAADAAEQEEEVEEALDEKLAHLKGETYAKKAKRRDVKEEDEEEDEGEHTFRANADWTGRAAPETPAAAGGRQWASAGWGQQSGRFAAAFANKGKGKGKRPPRSFGIVSLDESARLHGVKDEFGYGQLARHSDAQVRYSTKEEQTEPGSGVKRGASGASAPMAKFKKGTPTVAPMTPGPADPKEEL